MKKPVARMLPEQPYVITDVEFFGDGAHCENCGRLIHYVATVQGRDAKTFGIGMDCAETLVQASNYYNFDRKLVEVRKALGWLNKYERRRQDPYEVQWDAEYNLQLTVKWNDGWGHVEITIPGGFSQYEKTHNTTASLWHKLYAGVRARLLALGATLPTDVPETDPPSKWTKLK